MLSGPDGGGNGGADQQRLETLQQDFKFINNLLSDCGLEAPFPFKVIGDTSSGHASEMYNLEAAVRILISLLNSKQVGPTLSPSPLL